MSAIPKIVFQIRTTEEAARLLKDMALEAKRDYGDEFEIIIKNEYERRQALKAPTNPLSNKRTPKPSNN